MKKKLLRIVSRISVVLFIITILTTRLFAYFVLGEPFLGDTLAPMFSEKEVPRTLNSNELQSLKENINTIPLLELKNNHGTFSFLNKTKIRDAEIIGLGEATYGTREFFELKNGLFQFLVNHHDVKLFGIEANFAACYDINKYILTGRGNAKEALSKNGYWVWQSQEVLELIEWMKNYNTNQSSDQKIQFYGYDMQDATSAIVWLENYLSNHLPEFDKSILPDKFDSSSDKLRKLKQKEIESMVKINLVKTSDLKTLLNKHETHLINIDTTEYQFAKQAAEIILQKLLLISENDFNKAYSFRDSSMAHNIKWIRENNQNHKIVLWAHNGHIGRGSFSDDFKTGNWMGTHLTTIYGGKYYNIGFSFNEGGFVSQSPPSTNLIYLMASFVKSIFKDEPWKILNNYVKPHPRSYLTHTFSKLNAPCFFLEFKALSEHKAVVDFINHEFEHFEAGAVYINEKSALWTTNLYQLFDAVIYVDKATPANNFFVGKYAK